MKPENPIEWGIIAAIIRDFHAAIQKPKIAKAVLFPSLHFSNLRLRLVAREMLLADGNFETFKNSICWNPATKSWRQKFIEWAESKREKKRVLLLPEKCGGEK